MFTLLEKVADGDAMISFLLGDVKKIGHVPTHVKLEVWVLSIMVVYAVMFSYTSAHPAFHCQLCKIFQIPVD